MRFGTHPCFFNNFRINFNAAPGIPFGLHEKIQNLVFIVDGTP